MAEIIDLSKYREEKRENELTMDEYMALHPEMLGDGAFRKADELIDRFGTQEDKERIKEMDALGDALDSLGDSEFENRRRDILVEQITEELKNLDI